MSMMPYDAKPMDLSFIDGSNKNNTEESELAMKLAVQVSTKTSGQINIQLNGTYQQSASPNATAASTPRKQPIRPTQTTSFSSTRSSRKSNSSYARPPSYSFDDRDRINLPIVEMRTISNEEQCANKKNATTHPYQKNRSHSVGGHSSGDSNGTSNGSTQRRRHGSSNKGKNGENTGRWTSNEHSLFLEGLQNYGKEWKRIADLIQTRTVVQIRTHAQKYFQKVAKAREMSNEPVPGTFRSTAMSTCEKNQQKCRKRKKNSNNGNNVYNTSTTMNSGFYMNSNQTYSSSIASNSRSNKNTKRTKRTKRKSRSKTFSGYPMADQTLTRQLNIDNDHLLKLDLFRTSLASVGYASAAFYDTSNGTNKNKFVNGTTKDMSVSVGGDESPTTAVTDLFAGGSMIGLDFFGHEIDDYDFNIYEEKKEKEDGKKETVLDALDAVLMHEDSDDGNESTSSNSSTTNTPPQSLQKIPVGPKQSKQGHTNTYNTSIKLRQEKVSVKSSSFNFDLPSKGTAFHQTTIKLTVNDEVEENIVNDLLAM